MIPSPLAKGTGVNIESRILKEKRRGDCYKLLAACFYLPRKMLYLEEGILRSLAALFGEVCLEAAPCLAQMEEAFLTYSEEELSIEYARLFVGPFELKAPPYGSVYLDGGRRVMGDSTMEVVRIYEKTGLAMDKEFKELPDHIAVELEFMYYLIYKEVEALEKLEKDKALALEETRNHFFNRFLSPWIPPFCEKIKETTDNHFYIALADCLSTFITNQSRN
jgi:TorA maturation chaperone TorD